MQFIVLKQLTEKEKTDLENIEKGYKRIYHLEQKLAKKRAGYYKNLCSGHSIQVGEVLKIKDGFLFKKIGGSNGKFSK